MLLFNAIFLLHAMTCPHSHAHVMPHLCFLYSQKSAPYTMPCMIIALCLWRMTVNARFSRLPIEATVLVQGWTLPNKVKVESASGRKKLRFFFAMNKSSPSMQSDIRILRRKIPSVFIIFTWSVVMHPFFYFLWSLMKFYWCKQRRYLIRIALVDFTNEVFSRCFVAKLVFHFPFALQRVNKDKATLGLLVITLNEFNIH